MQVEALRETLERLRAEVTELRASRERLVLAADSDRHRIERELHENVQQHLVALAVNLQLAGPLLDEHAAAKTLLGELQRDVQQALEDTARLAERIYPPLLEIGGLAAALRAAALSAGITVSVEVSVSSTFPPEVARTVYFCWLDALDRARDGGKAAVAVREQDDALTFELVEEGASLMAAAHGSTPWLDGMRDRVEALGGQLTVEADPARSTRVYGSLPLVR